MYPVTVNIIHCTLGKRRPLKDERISKGQGASLVNRCIPMSYQWILHACYIGQSRSNTSDVIF